MEEFLSPRFCDRKDTSPITQPSSMSSILDPALYFSIYMHAGDAQVSHVALTPSPPNRI